jgi:oligopeptide transport system permease protein
MSPSPIAASFQSDQHLGIWTYTARRLRQDRVGMLSLVVVLCLMALISSTALGWVAQSWQQEVAIPNAPPSFWGLLTVIPDDLNQPTLNISKSRNVDLAAIDPLAPRYAQWNARAKQLQTVKVHKLQSLPLGSDRLGRSVLDKAIKGAQISITVGVLAAVMATVIGTALGALSGFLGGRIGDVLEWLYNVFTSIPGILLVFTFAALLNRADAWLPQGIWSVVVILGLTGWTGIYRLTRSEFMKHAHRDYVRAAQALGVNKRQRMFHHILPNVSHVILVQLSIHVVGFIKAEVILSYLGLGVAVDQVSWGTMLAEAQSELILGHWWQLATATCLMAVFVTAFSLLTDALRDAMDPKLGGLREAHRAC